MVKELNEIVGILAKNGIEEFEHELEGKKLKIKCRTTTKPSEKPHLQQKTAEEKPKEQVKPQEIQTYTLNSKHVGYFHILKQKTGEKVEEIIEQIQETAESLEESFVKIGDKVGLETILGTVECMKIQNEIKLANYKSFQGNYGIIEGILENEGTPVDYGRSLFQIRPVKEIE